MTSGQHKGLFSAEDRNKIFGNIQSVYSVNQKFLADLKARLTKWTDTTPVADLFLGMVRGAEAERAKESFFTTYFVISFEMPEWLVAVGRS